MTAPEARAGSRESNARGLIVLAVALVVGFLLLWSWGDDSSSSNASSNGGSTVTSSTLDISATTSEATTSTTAGSTRSPSEVSVIVLNGSGQTGAAGTNSTTIGESGYTMLTPGNAPTTETTVVYYADGYQEDAIAVAGILGKGTDAVKPLSEASLGGAEGDADVVVVLGGDIPPVSGTTTTTSL